MQPEAQSPNERRTVRFRGRRQLSLIQPGEDEMIDRVSRPAGIRYTWDGLAPQR